MTRQHPTIRNAVIPVAGLGTRLLPATKSQPKEMLPIGRKPVVQYVVEEIEQAGVRSIIFVTGRKKRSIEDHFDLDPELMDALNSSGNDERLDELLFEKLGMNYFYVRQSEQRGLGHAIGCAEHFIIDKPFVCALGDSIISQPKRCSLTRRLMDCFSDKRAAAVIGFEEVARKDVHQYGIAWPAEDGPVFRIKDLVEKPSVESAPSRLAIAGRYVFAPTIFAAIRHTRPGKKGEVQITDAIRLLIKSGEPVYGVKLHRGEQRYDIGNFGSYYRSFVDFALADKRYGPALRRYLKRKLQGKK